MVSCLKSSWLFALSPLAPILCRCSVCFLVVPCRGLVRLCAGAVLLRFGLYSRGLEFYPKKRSSLGTDDCPVIVKGTKRPRAR